MVISANSLAWQAVIWVIWSNTCHSSHKCWDFEYLWHINKLLCVCMWVAQLCPTLCDSMNCSLPGSSVHRIVQARIPEWVAISFSRRSSQARDWTQFSRTAWRFFTIWATKEVQYYCIVKYFKNYKILYTSNYFRNNQVAWCMAMLCYAMLSHFSRVQLCATP